MSEDPTQLRIFSLHLSRTLDEIGVNTITVKRRRRYFLYMEQMIVLGWLLSGKDCCAYYHFGSQTEGTTSLGLNSDQDCLVCHVEAKVIEDWADWKQGEDNLLMLEEGTAPGYCRLQRLRKDAPTVATVLENEDETFDNNGKVIVKNTRLHTYGPEFVRHGPAMTSSCLPHTDEHDIVLAFRCNTWPSQAAEFITRPRRHGWPSQQLVQEAVSQGVFLVPVGYKLSPTESLEWRISASLAERCLMFSLGIVHIKCYVVLKMLKKTFVDPRVRDCLSSYHCKTALLYCTESTEPGFWREDNLLQCVRRCLSMLLTWVTNDFCPQFIISKENLFAGKVTETNRDMLRSILTELIQNTYDAVLGVSIDDLGYILQTKLGTVPSVPSMLAFIDSANTVRLILMVEIWRIASLIKCTMIVMQNDKSKTSVIAIQSVYQKIRMLKEMIRQDNIRTHRRQAMQDYIDFFTLWLGSLMASYSLSHKKPVPRLALRLLCKKATSDVASMLKVASVLYCNGEFSKVESILRTVETHFTHWPIQLICTCCHKRVRQPIVLAYTVKALKARKTRNKLFAQCMRLSVHEIHCAPPALQYELYRSVSDGIHHRDPTYGTVMDLAVVDCLPYLYYLQYMTYRQLGKHDRQKRSLHNLDRCIREDFEFGHLEAAWNLLGQSMELEQGPEAAMACYKTSLGIRPRKNAAKWHVAILCYKVFEQVKNH